ncbi:universal stress protein [Leifsonia poae]|uniref:universal stress protein n=1 Tax=Leifsonia poae TaxID=110933 RepID=UPI0022F26A81|nr:universal stress protein [Leifsonia poae]
MNESIVVAVDGDLAHRAPIAWAVERALHTDARIELLTVIERSWGDHDPGPGRLLTAAAQALLDNAVRYARRRLDTVPEGRTELTTRWAYGHVADELDRTSYDTDMLVIGARRTRDVADAFHGSLALRVASTAACTVVVVPHDWAGAGDGIVVGVDGDLPAETALWFAADEAVAHRQSLTIVCGGYSSNPLLAGLVPERSLGDRRQHIMEAAAESVRQSYPGLRVDKRIIEASPPVALINASVGRRLLVVGSRGRHGAKRVLLGSVGHDVLLNLSCPVAVVRNRSMGEERTDD